MTPLSFAATESESEVTTEVLRQSFHRFESVYQYSRVRGLRTHQIQTLQSLLLSGDVVLTPQVSVSGTLPIMTLSHELALVNPWLGVKAYLFEGLVKDFPTFVTASAMVRPPLSSEYEFVFDRTDVEFGLSTLREIHHLSLTTDFRYNIKIDSPDADQSYGNEWSAKMGGELNTGYHFSPGVSLNYRYAGPFQKNSQRFSGRSVMIVQPTFAYNYEADMTFKGVFALPLNHHQLQESLQVFGDYTIAGIGGNTFYVLFEKKF
ncbi:MAG: transporter [Deltaproteobacteria bacterium]|nr:transporter [Deltaproteobacteria bacterium]